MRIIAIRIFFLYLTVFAMYKHLGGLGLFGQVFGSRYSFFFVMMSAHGFNDVFLLHRPEASEGDNVVFFSSHNGYDFRGNGASTFSDSMEKKKYMGPDVTND